MTRAEALERGLTSYDNGIPCLHGHRCRYTQSGACKLCDKLRHRKPRGMSYKYKKPQADPPFPIAQQRRYSTFIAPPTLARLMSRR